jgi:hypothetical protein
MLRDGDGPFGLPVGLVALALVAAGAGILLATPFRFASVPTQLAIGLLGGGLLVLAGILLLTDDLSEAATHFLGDRE